ncbi:MAG: glycoside hydrolase family 3 protein [Ruminococcaceae bacterium]|nr:glycoside hydrolase family 3 protein [Oscillospiraceae bacterium]
MKMTFEERARELVSKMTLAEKMSQMKYNADPIERLGIPGYSWWHEALHGVQRSGSATVFPQSIGMAASFDDELLQEIGSAVGDEARAKYNEFKKFGHLEIHEGLNVYAPNINIVRDPRWGRGQETYGEDPYLTGRMGTAYVKGLQGDGKYHKIDATLKHYAVHSGPEAKRHSFDAKVSEKDLYETYLWAFKYCIDHAKPAAVMGAYNKINGEPACASPTYLKDILRNELGFEGYVVSDCGAVCYLHKHHKVTENDAESAALAVNNGCDLNCGDGYKWLKTAYALGMIDEDVITESVVKLFTARFRLGMFDDDCEYDHIPFDVIECEKHRALNRKMAQESMVLLKNNGILPLKKEIKTIAVIGPNADSLAALQGTYYGEPSVYTTLLRGIQEGSDAKVIYTSAFSVETGQPLYWNDHVYRPALVAANKADVVVLCMGLSRNLEGEAGDEYNNEWSGDKPTLELPEHQRKLIKRIVETGKPVVFVNVSGSCVNLSYEKEHCDAIIQCFYPGAEGGNALADILFGKVSPSGRLPVTFYESVEDLPDFEDYSMENRTYKFFKGTPVYEFGYGLTYSKIKEEWLDENTVKVTNTGNFDTAYSVLKFEYIPHKNLCGFKKVFLKQGESQTITFGKDE